MVEIAGKGTNRDLNPTDVSTFLLRFDWRRSRQHI
jgi:hypothetical protein